MNTPADETGTPTLFEWAGGQARLDELFTRFYEHVRQDDILRDVFSQMPADHARTVAGFVGEVFGGPPRYTGDGGRSHATMVARHIGRHLTETQRQRWMRLLLDTADELALPSDPEFRSALVGYLEWGSRIAVMNSKTEDNPIGSGASMPRWGWGEVKGPYRE